MADPFSLATSVFGVATAAFGISKKLHGLVQDFRDAPKKFEVLADQIERDATLLRCSVELIQDHKDLFKPELEDLLRDINGQFANINGLVEKLLPGSRHRRRDKLIHMINVLWNSNKLEDIMVQLEALRSTLALIVGIAQYAETRASRQVKASTIELFRAEASHAMEDCLRNIWNLQNQGHNRLPTGQSKLLTFDESPADMAAWMAVNLSAPNVPTKSLPDPNSSVGGVKMVKVHRKSGLPFGPVVRAKPRLHVSEGKSDREVRFQAGDLDLKTLRIYGLPYRESVSPDGTSELIIRPAEPLKPHEVDMIVGMDLMTKLPRTRNWTTEQTPFVYLPKDIVLGRLLTEWTKMDAQQIQETTNVTLDVEDDLDLDSDSDGGASTATFSDDYEELVSNEKQRRSRGSSKDKSQQQRTRFLSTDGLAGRFERKIFSEDILPTGFVQTSHPNAMPDLRSSRRDVGSGRRPLSGHVPSWSKPKMMSSSHYYGQSNQNHSAFAYENPVQRQDFWPPQLPPPPRPPSPPCRPPSRNNDHGSETAANHAANDYRSGTPSMKDSTTAMVNGRSGATREETNKRRDSDEPSYRPRNVAKMHVADEGESFETGNAYPQKDAQQAELNGSRHVDISAARQEQAEWEQRHIQDTKDIDERWEKALRLEEADKEQRKYRDYLEVYKQMVEKAYAELKREETDKQQIIEAVKEQVTAELKLEQKVAAIEAREEEIRKEQERLAKTEREPVDTGHRAPQRGSDHFVRQFMDRPRGTMDDDATEDVMIQDAIQRFAGPYHTDFEVMSYATDEATRAPASLLVDGTSSDDEDSDEVESDDTVTNRPAHDDEPSNSDVERSQPWKGPAHVGNCIEVNPLYLRGSDAGQTWYHGANPVYIVEFEEGYNGEDSYEETPGSTCRGQYLLISKLWVDAEVLDKFGFKHSSCPPTYFYLNPSLTWESIETLVNFTFYLREVESFRIFGQANDPSFTGGRPPPPPLEFFAHGKLERQPSETAPPEPDVEHSKTDKAEEKQWTFGSSLVYPLSVLNFALHTIS